ncbi:hypothetical protein BUALT_Bualt11G0050500 [Buddleja alternifolia]|uniref:RNase H type-1 domain-containing protein n=1 Tax=Buddleja alternifolia TaxID=168488 RepID=A0AAV6WZQ9_9LAMI|nr:hypothetical protein BUALT_Bualt11G0050500 [Buddleja alternifolia]
MSEMGTGVVGRDSNGACCAWSCRCFPFCGGAEHAELMAAREGVELAIREGWTDVVFEGDNSSVISRFQSLEEDLSALGSLTQYIVLFGAGAGA